uniref:Phosphoinositide phospholipase C n=1 Tax=Astyanax mexicanus TaxID=7994 RepID=A0A3B1KDR1_ASTMX
MQLYNNKYNTIFSNKPTNVATSPNIQQLPNVDDDEDVQAMMQGSTMLKIGSPNWKWRRFLKLEDDKITICHHSKKSLKKSKTFKVEDVESVQEGCHSERQRSYEGFLPEEYCLTVVFKKNLKSLDLQCKSREEAQHWARGIRTLQQRMNNMSHKADLNNDGVLTFEEMKTLLQMVNIDLDEQHASQLFKECDQSGDMLLENEEIETFCCRLLQRPELENVFDQYSSKSHVLSTVKLRKFLKEQGEDSTLVHAENLILTYELDESAKQAQKMTLGGFTMYMLSKNNDIFDPEHDKIYQDMSRPLSHYFISSSHNTYLTKDQLVGESSTEPYIWALTQGCRCVELDCWDGDKEPVIFHGHTLTTKVPFKEVVKTIADYAFKTSPFPLILSLENHCSVEQQTIMAQQLRSILGDKLLTEPLSDQPCESLPSPEELKEKILVKVKKEQVDQPKDKSKAKGKTNAFVCTMSQELSDLVVYTRSVPFKGFSEAAKKPPNEMSSFTEKVALKHIKTSGKLFVQHNSQHLSRIYPSGFRLQSSNYDPQDMWNVGCQLVALNFQTDGEQMDLNRGRFLPNGRCGYVLKPSFLCQTDTEFNPDNKGGGPGHNHTLLTIQIISAQQLPKPENGKLKSIVDPMVWIEIHGVPIDNSKEKTKRIDNNGFNPTWNETFTFKLHVPELVLVRFVVEDHDHHSKNDFLGQFTLPFTSMQAGYRHVRLLGADGSSLSPASLFVHVKVTSNYGSPKHAASPKA